MNHDAHLLIELRRGPLGRGQPMRRGRRQLQRPSSPDQRTYPVRSV